MLKLLLVGYGNAAAPIAWRGACLGQKARRPLGEGRALRKKENKNKNKSQTPSLGPVAAAVSTC